MGSQLSTTVRDLLRESPLDTYQLASKLDCSMDALMRALGDLRRGGVVQLLGSTWRLTPLGARGDGAPVPVAAPAPPPRDWVGGETAFFERPVVDDEPASEPAAEPATPEPIQPTEPEPESDEMAKTKVCNKCEQRKPLDAFSKNSATPDGLQRTCRPCLAEYQAKARGSKKPAAPRGEKKPKTTTVIVKGQVATEEGLQELIEKAMAADPAPLLHPAPPSEVPSSSLEIFPVMGAVVVRQVAEIDGRTECHALLIPRGDIRSVIDKLTRQI